MRISDWSSDVCSSDLTLFLSSRGAGRARHGFRHALSAQPRMGLFSRAGPHRDRARKDHEGLTAMARYSFRLPDIGEGIAEAEIVAWHVKVGERVEEDAQLADLLTDKATGEMESPVSVGVVEVVIGRA